MVSAHHDPRMLAVEGSFVPPGHASPADVYSGTPGNDQRTGTAGGDFFNMSEGASYKGGEDTIKALGGDDVISFGATLDPGDKIDGGSGYDSLLIQGNYTGTHALAFAATTIGNVEEIDLGAGFSYDLTTNDGNLGTGKGLKVDGTGIDSSHFLRFDGSAEKDAGFDVIGGAGNDVLTGGRKSDLFDLKHGGSDTVHGGSGDDIIAMGGSLDSTDIVDGGSGENDDVTLNGAYSGTLTITSSMMKHVEVLDFQGAHDYAIALGAGVVAQGAVLRVTADMPVNQVFKLNFDGSAETTGHFVMDGGTGTDTLTGGSGDDVLVGKAGGDHLTGGGGSDTYWYDAVSESTGNAYDTITGFNFAGQDKIELHFSGASVTGKNAEVTAGSLSKATFDSDLTAALAGHLTKNHAILFQPDAGNLKGDLFLVVDCNSVAGYQSGQDIVIRLDSPVNPGQFDVSDFTF